jgi:glutathione synthase/RimK-type ligase-like ATP-grasp enzyme
MITTNDKYYPGQAKYAKLAAAQLGAEFIDLDNGNGYVFRVVKNGRSFTSGAGLICSYPINTASSFGISRDKAHTNAILRHYGIPCIDGRHFFVSSAYAALRNPGHEREDAFRYAAERGYPLFCKPLTGARGDFAEIVLDEDGLADYIERVGGKYHGFLIEPIVSGDEYRVLICDRAPVYFAMKKRPEIVGDGRRTLQELIDTVNASLAGKGVSAFPRSSITASGFRPDYVPGEAEVVPLSGRQNLSVTGGVTTLDTEVPSCLADLSVAACEAVGLRLGAVDIFDISERRDMSSLMVIEVNGNPALNALEASGRSDIILALWLRMIREFLGE